MIYLRSVSVTLDDFTNMNLFLLFCVISRRFKVLRAINQDGTFMINCIHEKSISNNSLYQFSSYESNKLLTCILVDKGWIVILMHSYDPLADQFDLL